jgi:carboxyvinyl-carboxyphosphonate phosphorylmutase
VNATARRERFRALLRGETCVFPASVFDAVTARLALEIGFETAILGGSVASAVVLGAPDVIVLTLAELAEQVRRIVRGAPIPLLVDADHGYGNALNVMRTVAELEQAGVAALTIEDTLLPARFGGVAGELVSRDEAAGKIAAALAAREDPATVIVARTNAAPLGLAEAVERAQRAAALGADAVFFVGITGVDQLDVLAEALDVPIMLGGGTAFGLDAAELAQRGVMVALQGHHTYAAAVEAARVTLQALRDGVLPAQLPGKPAPALMKRLTRDDAYARRSAAYLEPPPG